MTWQARGQRPPHAIRAATVLGGSDASPSERETMGVRMWVNVARTAKAAITADCSQSAAKRSGGRIRRSSLCEACDAAVIAKHDSGEAHIEASGL